MNLEPDVLIVGAGPAGLSAAHALKRRGIDKVLVVDRETEPGGIPRFCPHPTFGLAEFHRPMSGPAYAKALRSRVDPRLIAAATTVTAIGPDLETSLSSADGETVIRPKRLLLATGIRETPRSARLVSGDRPRNVLTTGALQRLLFEGKPLPFKRPLIVGTELVSFSALLSLRDAGLRAVAMIEPGERIVARRPADLFARFLLGTPVRLGSRIVSINAEAANAARLASVTIAGAGGERIDIACDAVIFTGGFVPEASLLGRRQELLDPGTRGPAVDQFGRLAESGFYAAGNVLRPVETAGWSAREGALAAAAIADDLAGRLSPAIRRVPIRVEPPVALSVPSAVAVPVGSGPLQLQLRVLEAVRGRVTLSAGGATLWRSAVIHSLPERRILVRPLLPDLAKIGEITIGFDRDKPA
jgi:NADPH-dependent 2,4-dienoyl-CoA reductase/sulfur reductase-like enzyme